MTMPQQLAASPPLQASQFAGFTLSTTTPIPDQLIDELLSVLSGAELKVALYICRRTLGFQKMSDNISLRQLMEGIVKKNGERLDYGTGLSKPTLLKVLRDLETKQVIETVRRTSNERGDEATNYRLRFVAGIRLSFPCADQPQPKTMPMEPVGWRQPDYTPRGQKTLPGGWSKNVTTPLDKKSRPQETVIQKRETQETVVGIPDQESTNNRSGASTSTTVGVAFFSEVSSCGVEKTIQKSAPKTGDAHSFVTPPPSSGAPPSPEVAQHQTGASVLIAMGITPKVAQRLAARYSLKRIEEKLAYLEFLQAEQPDKVKNPHGWLRTAIEENYAAPDGYISLEERAQQATATSSMYEQQAAFANHVQAQADALRQQLRNQYGTTDQDEQLWDMTLKAMTLTRPDLESLFRSAHLLTCEGEKVLIGIEQAGIWRQLQHPHIQKVLQRSLQVAAGRKLIPEIVQLGVEPVGYNMEDGTGAPLH